MGKVLYVQASPRGERSKSVAVCDAFVEAYRRLHRGDPIETLNLFEADLIPFDGPAVQAKYTILHGREHTDQELAAWKAVEAVIDNFKSADRYVFAVPMWNFSVPYRLKQYIDILVQPGLTFSYSPDEGYRGLVLGKRAFLAYTRGGDYSAAPHDQFDHQKSYLELVLGFMGIEDIRSVVVEPTLMAGPQVAADKLQSATQQAQRLAADF